MIKRMIFCTLFIAGLLLNTYGQIRKNTSSNILPRIQNDAMRISFAKVGTVTQLDDSTYSVALSSSGILSSKAVVEISTTSRLFVNLPGSNGGRLYLDSSEAARLFKNRIGLDTVNTGQMNFHRAYWAVYAGMGMWDCVINCHVQQNGKYYIVSLVQEKQFGKPGEIVNGKTITTKELQSKALLALRDTTSNVVSEFNKLLSTVQIYK